MLATSKSVIELTAEQIIWTSSIYLVSSPSATRGNSHNIEPEYDSLILIDDGANDPMSGKTNL